MKDIVIVDIDGTISKVGDRLKYLHQDPPDWDSFYNNCFEDEPIREMLRLVYNLSYANYIHIREGTHNGYDIVFCTGRRECVRSKTVEWLKNHYDKDFLLFCMLLMRKDGDIRHDTEVKPELLREAGIDFNDIAFVIEDRSSMVKKWRELGLICLQPFEGDF